MQDQQENSNLQPLSRKPRKTHLMRVTHEERQLLQLFRTNVLFAYNLGLDQGIEEARRIRANVVNSLLELKAGVVGAP